MLCYTCRAMGLNLAWVMLIIDKIVGKRADAAPFKLLFGLETFEEAGQEGDEDSSRKKK
jgi:hypothetical protein